MEQSNNHIPIKGYARFHPLKHCWIGSSFKSEWFSEWFDDPKILGPLTRIAEETEEDYQRLEELLKSLGVKTHRSFLDIKKYDNIKQIYRPPVQPRDHFAVIGETLYIGDQIQGYNDVLKQIDTKNLYLNTKMKDVNTACMSLIGKDIFWGTSSTEGVEIVKPMLEEQGFRVHVTHRTYHSDGAYCPVKPGVIVTLRDIQNYDEDFPNWDILHLPDQSWSKVSPFLKMKEKVGGRWWLKGEEHNDQLIEFVNTWLKEWVGYVEETVFDVNMLSIDENTIICNNYNKEVFDFFKRHKVEPIVFNFRHRYFWDGGIHCITQDLYREGKQEDYFG